MKTSRWIPALMLMVLMLSITPTFARESTNHGQDPAGEEGLPAEMQAWIAAGLPNEHHQHLSRLAGEWDMNGKMWTTPGAPPVEFTGKSSNTMILGGRFLQSRISNEIAGVQFEAVGFEGYDNVGKKHISLSIDNSGTGIQFSEGECSEDDNVITSTTGYFDPATGATKKMKTRLTIVSDDQYIFEAWEQGVDGEDILMGKVIHTRKP